MEFPRYIIFIRLQRTKIKENQETYWNFRHSAVVFTGYQNKIFHISGMEHSPLLHGEISVPLNNIAHGNVRNYCYVSKEVFIPRTDCYSHFAVRWPASLQI